MKPRGDGVAGEPRLRRPRLSADGALIVAVALLAACQSLAPSPPIASSSPSLASSAIAPECPPRAVAAPTAIPADGPGWWRDRVFYEIFVRSFADSDGDGIGDLRGLIGRLDYLNDGDPTTSDDLGVTGIWLMPIAEAASYHGYDVTDYRAVEHDYGTAADMRMLVAAAHERGIAVIVDMVPNHTSDQHPWFRDAITPGSAHDDWYVWSDTNPGYGGPAGQLVWHPAAGRFYYGLFWAGMPDLNLRNPAVTAELDDIARFWLSEMGVDGFRLDAVTHLVEAGTDQLNTPETHAWLRAFHGAVQAARPGALLVGEAWDVARTTASYVPEDVDLVFEFALAAATVTAVQRETARPLLAAELETLELYGSGEYATFLTNHDQSRVASQLGGDPDKLRLAAELLLTGTGVPFVYYGEELGLTGAKPDERIRTPMAWTVDGPAAGFTTGLPWEPLEEGWQTRNVATQSSDPGSLLASYRDLIRLRGAHAALRVGDARIVASTADPVAAMLRTSVDETLLVIANLSSGVVTDYALSLGAGPLCGRPVAAAVFAGGSEGGGTAAPGPPTVTPTGGFSDYLPLRSLPPRSVNVISLQP